MSIPEWLAVLNFLLVIAGLVGGFFALRSGLAKAEQDVQTRIRDALHDENELLQSQVKRQAQELIQVKMLLHLLVEMLKKYRGMEVDASNDTIIIRDGQQTYMAHLPVQDGKVP